MDGKRLIRSIKLTNLLSFGPDGMEIELQPLNVLIGANGSGKSNFIEAFRLLNATPTNFSKPVEEGGGAREWLWKGGDDSPTAQITLFMFYFRGGRRRSLAYHLDFGIYDGSLFVVNEDVDDHGENGGEEVKPIVRVPREPRTSDEFISPEEATKIMSKTVLNTLGHSKR
jgi:predicted ATPase